ncbi:MAG TPA: DinB family protein [Acidimicrobiales bacterium]|nr:DinB family protein [Acidimicrobiales bacterium]
MDLVEALIAFSDNTYERLRRRLEGIEVDELLWEPAPGSWSVRAREDGSAFMDFGLGGTSMVPAITPAPVTTIAWRVAHIVDLLKEDRCATVLDLEPEANAGELWLTTRPEEMLDYLERAHATWRGYLSRTDPAALLHAVDRWGTRLSFVHHIIDEFVHHAAEIGVLRDLWSAGRESHGLLGAVLRADRDAVAQAGDDAVLTLREERAGLLVEAASVGRWAVADLLLDLGFAPELPPGPSALHFAAGLGRMDLVRRLVEAGASTEAADDRFHATPLAWAELVSQRLGGSAAPQASGADWQTVIEFLRRRATSSSGEMRDVTGE